MARERSKKAAAQHPSTKVCVVFVVPKALPKIDQGFGWDPLWFALCAAARLDTSGQSGRVAWPREPPCGVHGPDVPATGIATPSDPRCDSRAGAAWFAWMPLFPTRLSLKSAVSV